MSTSPSTDGKPGRESFLVTGALGCLGAWTVARLVRENMRVVALDAGTDRSRLALLLSEAEMARVTFVRADIAEQRALEAVLDGHAITHVIHFAALLHPGFRADPRLGARVNVLGGINLFEAAAERRERIRRIVFASSIAVYGEAGGASGAIGHDFVGRPSSLYGAFKQAEEHMARVYLQERGVNSIGLRPATVIGAGREGGLTAAPTMAARAAAHGERYHIAYGGRSQLQYAGDIADAFIACARSAVEGSHTFNMRGTVAHMSDVVETIGSIVPSSRGRITFEGPDLGLPEDCEDVALRAAIGPVPRTTLIDALRETVEIYRRNARGAVHV